MSSLQMTVAAAVGVAAILAYAGTNSGLLIESRSVSAAQDIAPDQQQSGGLQGFPDLVAGLSVTQGCLGVDTAQTSSGKNVIFAWFEDKAAVMRWYRSDMHQGAMRMFFPGAGGQRTPMEGVPDNVPLLVIASLTIADRQELQETTLPISQIAIELYAPVSGGLYLGGRFAPDSLDVPEMRDFTLKRGR